MVPSVKEELEVSSRLCSGLMCLLGSLALGLFPISSLAGDRPDQLIALTLP